MNIDTANWLWPQWALLIFFFLHFLTASGMHGKDRIERTGDNKGAPEKHSAFFTAARIALIMFFTIAGGFFK